VLDSCNQQRRPIQGSFVDLNSRGGLKFSGGFSP